MKDCFNRNINYLRISVTDKCNLRCVYCMPSCGIQSIPMSEILSYEEIIRLCTIFAKLGIKNIKITGGEPLVRRDISYLITKIKEIPGIEKVTLTTNGIALSDNLDNLVKAGLDGVNISIDALDDNIYKEITGSYGVNKVLESIDKALSFDKLIVKVNCVPFEKNTSEFISLASLAKDRQLSVRFIELMPIGLGANFKVHNEEEVKTILEKEFGTFSLCDEKLGQGPCTYYNVPSFKGKIGFISSISHKFCHTCNRIRLTSTGFLKTCLQYEKGVDLKPLLSQDDDVIYNAIEKAILQKPEAHKFGAKSINDRELKIMSQIGG